MKKLNINEDKRIVNTTPWLDLSVISTGGSAQHREMQRTYGIENNDSYPGEDEFLTHGIYQVAHKDNVDEIGDNLAHSLIGYTGSSKCVFGRVYSMKAPQGPHPVAVAITRETLIEEFNVKSRDDLLIRYVITEPKDYQNLENDIHNKSKLEFGLPFQWPTASLGKSGKYTHITSEIAKHLTSDQCLELIKFCRIEGQKKAGEEFLMKMVEE